MLIRSHFLPIVKQTSPTNFFPLARFVSKIKRELKAKLFEISTLIFHHPDISYFRTGIKLPRVEFVCSSIHSILTSFCFPTTKWCNFTVTGYQHQPLEKTYTISRQQLQTRRRQKSPVLLIFYSATPSHWEKKVREKKKKLLHTIFGSSNYFQQYCSSNSTSKSDLPATGKQFSFDVQGLH